MATTMELRIQFFVVVSLIGIAGCSDMNDLMPSEIHADTRETTALSIEKTIKDMVHASKDWEMAQYRTYLQQDIDGDGVDDTILLTTFEHDNGWRRELFVCLSSSPKNVMHVNLGGKGERETDSIEVTNRLIIVKGMRYGNDDAMCCPSIPSGSTFAVVNGQIVEKRTMIFNSSTEVGSQKQTKETK